MAADQEPSGATSRLRPQAQLSRAASGGAEEIFMLSRQKSRSRERRESRMFLVDGQLCWADDIAAQSANQSPGGYNMGKRSSSIGLMFGSSMDLSGLVAAGGQSIDSSGGAGSGNEEAISYRIKWCRENILQLKRQCWPMEKKLQVLRASKLFIKQHQGELKQSKQAKDVLAGTSAIFERYWRHFKREFANFLVIITPWEMRIKKIESHFGSVVASYFTFLRWIFWLNLANSLVMVSFVMVPELIENVPDLTGMRKGELGMQRSPEQAPAPDKAPDFNPTLGEMWEFEGFLKFSPIFYGYYSNVEISRSGFWRNPLAFLLAAMVTYLFCFFCISRKLSQNTKLSRIGSKDDEYTFCWTVFVGWDFMIGNSETAYNKTSSLVMNLKEGILEEKEQTKDRDWRLILRRVFANVLTIMLIIASAYVVTLAVQRSENLPEDASLLQKNELQLVMSGIQFMFPPLFDVIGIIEKYHPRKALSWQLGRILFLDFLNFYTLMFSLFGTVDQMGKQLNEVSGNITLFRKNTTYYNNLFTTTTTSSTTTTTTTTSTTTTTEAPISSVASWMSSTQESTVMSGNFTGQVEMWTTTSASLNRSVAPDGQGSAPARESNVSTTAISITDLPSTVTTSEAPTEPPATRPQLAGGSLAPPGGATSTAGSARDHAGAATGAASGGPIPSSTPLATSLVVEGSTQPVATGTPSPDEDYPDIGEALKQQGARRRRQLERDASLADVNRLTAYQQQTSRASKAPVAAAADETHQRLAVGLPPIKDPYGRLGSRLRRPEQAPAATRGLGQVFFAPREPRPNEDEEEEDDEEPLEGRLEPSRMRATSSTGAPRTTSSKRPRMGQPRPIGARPSGRVIAARPPPSADESRASTDDLNGDADEDLRTDVLPTGPILSEPAGEPMTPAGPGSSVETARSVDTDAGQASSGAADVAAAGAAAAAPAMSSSDSVPEPDGATSGTTTTAVASARFGATFPMDTTSALEPSSGATSPQPVGGCPLGAGASTTTNSDAAAADSPSVLIPRDANNNNNNNNKPLNDSLDGSERCVAPPDFKPQEILALNDTLKDKLKTLCWETMFGQEMVKIVVMDLVMTVVSAVSFEFMRACFVRYCNRFFFWDLERGLPGYQDFKLAENVLHLVNNQSTVWMGMFFAPGLPAINTVKLAVLMYVRSWAVLTCNIPHETVFKVSKSNNFYYWILLINLLICILPVAYAVTWIRPSWHCGPFGGECRMYLVVTKLVKQLLPAEANSVFRYITSPGAVIPILIALILIIYYLASTVSSSKEANKELKAQLKKDKEHEAAVPEITTLAEPAQAAAVSAPEAPPPPGGPALVPVAPVPGPSDAVRPKSLLAPPPI